MAARFAGVVVVCLLSASSGFAAELISQKDGLVRLHDANLQRISWGELAQQRSSNEAVKRLGERLAKVDAELDRAVLEYAKANGIVLPEKPAAQPPLGRLEGASFDTFFLSRVAASNKQLISFLLVAEQQHEDPTFRRLLNKALSTYRDDQRELERVYEELPQG